MALTLGAPLFLLLLVPLAVLAGRRLAVARRAYLADRRYLAVLALRCASLALLIMALAQPAWRRVDDVPLEEVPTGDRRRAHPRAHQHRLAGRDDAR